MIKSLYILRRNGMLLYSESFIKQPFDENLILGFFSSVVNFSREGLESIVDFVDLGKDSKVIFELNTQENIFGAAIVSIKDNNGLVKTILKTLLTDFIDEFSPAYDLELVKNREKMDDIIKDNLRRRGTSSLLLRFIISIIVLIGIGVVLTIINIWVFANFILRNIPIYITPENLVKQTIPILVLGLFAELIILFGIGNFISGYILLNLKVSILNAIIYFILIIIAHLFALGAIASILIYPILSFLPFVAIASLGGAYLGNEFAKTKRLT